MTATMETYALHPPLVDEAAVRRTLRDQITRLEDELSGLVLSAWPATIPVGTAGASSRGAALLSLAQLEQARDALAARAAAARRELDERGRLQEEARRAREEMLLDPAAYPFARVTNEAVGEPGCRDWHVRPRFGLLGMIMRWWRVVVSSGCPSAGRLAAAGARQTPATNHVEFLTFAGAHVVSVAPWFGGVGSASAKRGTRARS